MIKKVISVVFVLLFAVSLGVVSYASKALQKPLTISDSDVVYQVKPGASIKRVLADFERLGWIEQRRIHEIWLRYNQLTNIQKGEYTLTEELTSEAAIRLMVDGKKILRSVQFIEGKTFRDNLDVLKRNEFIEQTLSNLTKDEILNLVDPELAHYEGWFFPDTYLFEKGTTDLEILKTSHSRMKQILEGAWKEKSEEAEVTSPYETLILASIIEKETGAAFERPMISGVFTRRLQKGMRLQTDPTVIYGLGESFDGNLTRKHLRTDTIYNTYTRNGLPPTPIANPGREAIVAALNPADGTEIFFVAKGDGTHQFSDTLQEHNAAVRQYQRFGRRDDYQSSPAPTEETSN